MTKLYVSKIDNKTFNTEKELIEHLKVNYSMVDESGGESANILNRLQTAFPFAIVSVKETSEREYGTHICSMKWEEYDGDFSFYIGTHSDYNYYCMSFETVNDAISYYNEYLYKKDEITKRLEELYEPDKVEIGQMYEGDMNSSNSILFIITKNGECYSERYEFEEINEFINSFKGYFDNVIEGEVLIERDYANGYEKEPKVGGVPIKNILKRSKRIRIEILEYK